MHFQKDCERIIQTTGYSYQTLRKDKYLAERIPPERRRPQLDVAIHHEVAPLAQEQQELLLDKAETEGLTVQQIRREKHWLALEASRPKAPALAKTETGLFLGDCVEVLQEFPENSIDCLVTDPPYGINYQSEHRALPFTRLINDDEHAFAVLDTALALTFQKLKQNSHVYMFTCWQTYPQMVSVVTKHFTIKNVLIWEKNNWTPGDLEANYGHQYEMLIFAQKGRRHLFGSRDANVLHFDRVEAQRMQYPTEKPVKLLQYLIAKSTKEGETALDLFMGSGSTYLAAKQTNRKYIGIEIDETWFHIARARLG